MSGCILDTMSDEDAKRMFGEAVAQRCDCPAKGACHLRVFGNEIVLTNLLATARRDDAEAAEFARTGVEPGADDGREPAPEDASDPTPVWVFDRPEEA